jgi:hypothetical protein
VQLAMAGGTAYGIGTVIVRTGALPPWPLSLASVLLPLAGWIAATTNPVRRAAPGPAR